MMNKLIIFGGVLLLLICLSNSSVAINIWPGIMTIDMPEGYPKEPISYKIEVTNKHSNDINVTAKARDVINASLGFQNIPDLSWINIEPEILFVPGNSTKNFEVSIDIPDSEKPLHYNESWESRIIITSDPPKLNGGGLAFNVELAVKLYIHTPPEIEKPETTSNLYYLLILIILFISIVIVVFIFKRSKLNGYI